MPSKIEWTDETWNPVTGCTKVGPGCDRCYAERWAERWRGAVSSTGRPHPFFQGFDLKLHPDRLDIPFTWRKPRMVFTCSMSDLFHKDIPDDFRDRVWDTMEGAWWHTFQVLTKRSSLMAKYLARRYADLGVPRNVWCGVSVESRKYVSRIDHLRKVNCGRRFISFEPLLGCVGEVDLTGIHWAIAGGESGPGFRAPDGDWFRNVRDRCADAEVEFFFKQWGGTRPTDGGRELDGAVHDGFPLPLGDGVLL